MELPIEEPAVYICQAYKTYGSNKNKCMVLNGLNMTVPKGRIYSLLGASGCGKTTLLSCIIGRCILDSGDIWIQNNQNKKRNQCVGYMPQELALYSEFTLSETLIYFGWIMALSTAYVANKMEFLLKLLELPHANRFVKDLSSGQQRRMSLAVALLHNPELLILDEPTVGSDPVLRKIIWDHFIKLCESEQKTIIITTHYVDETLRSDTVGLMRDGKFLAEDSPTNLLKRFESDSLEDVFFNLSLISASADKNKQIANKKNLYPYMTNIKQINEIKSYLKGHRLKALLWKNFLWMWRNIYVMIFLIGLPCAQIILFCLAIGHNPTGLIFAIHNNEINQIDECDGAAMNSTQSLLSCRFLDGLKEENYKIENFKSDGEAIKEVEYGKASGAMIFSIDFSDQLPNSIQNYSTDFQQQSANIEIFLDMSEQQLAYQLYRDIQTVYTKFMDQYLNESMINPSFGRLPIQWKQPIYGDNNPTFTDFAAPGIMLTIIFFVTLALSSGTMLIERNEQILERSLVSGISVLEIFCAQFLSQILILFLQTGLVIWLGFYVFHLKLAGSILLAILLTILTGICGMSFGFLVSSACDSERIATIMAMGSYLPMVVLSGMVWPMEGMHSILQYIALFLPLTKSTEMFRSITQRGWSIDRPEIYCGFIYTVLWIVFYLFLSFLLLKFKKL